MSHARYMPHTIMSPWAKFTTRMTPKISVRPTAIRLNTPPNSTPLSRPCATSVASIASGLGARGHELLQRGDLAGFVQSRTAGTDDAERLDALLADLGQQQQRAGRPRDRRDHIGFERLQPRDLRREIRRRLGPWDDVVLQQRPRRLGGLVGGEKTARLVDAEQVVAVHERDARSEEHTSELQSLTNLVCRLLLEKKKQGQ